eukprot:GEMP01046637.1.p1 GENE.GEMP01046637.1~~GEMP01046637.1.p1  ORF type:complete len:542 (+),score=15.77 GEMP01046637.1:152-1627(+)
MLTYASRVRLPFGGAWAVRLTELLQGLRSAKVATPRPSCLELNVEPKASGSISALRLSLASTSYQALPVSTFLTQGNIEDKDRVSLLKAHVEEARTPRDRSTYQKRMKSEERTNLEGKLCCIKCGFFKAAESFAVKSSSACGRQSYCRVCAADWTRKDNGFTLRRIMKEMLSGARRKALKRSEKPSRKLAGEFDINVDDLLDKWKKQEGRCAYSEVVMNIERYTPWHLSLERCDNTLGYTRENTVFVCSEFNTMDHSVRVNGNVQGSSKWYRHKVLSLPERINYSGPLDDFELDKILSTTRVTKERHCFLLREVAANGDLRCASCNKFKSPDDFYSARSSSVRKQSYCKVCQRTRIAEYRRSTLGFFKKLLESAKTAAKGRTDKGRDTAGEFRLEFDDILQMYRQQRGLCFYSDVKMNLQPHHDWKGSIERIDNAKGYILSNVVLICSEFQTSDSSFRANIPVKGTAQWSKEKVRKLILWLEFRKLLLRGG